MYHLVQQLPIWGWWWRSWMRNFAISSCLYNYIFVSFMQLVSYRWACDRRKPRRGCEYNWTALKYFKKCPVLKHPKCVQAKLMNFFIVRAYSSRVAQFVQAFKPGFEDFSNLWGFLWSLRVKMRPAIGGEKAVLTPQSSLLNLQASILSPQSSVFRNAQ